MVPMPAELEPDFKRRMEPAEIVRLLGDLERQLVRSEKSQRSSTPVMRRAPRWKVT
jgi:hypothetical protein